MNVLMAQIDVKPLAEGLGANFLPYALALALVALGLAVKYAIDQNAKHAAAVEKLNADRLADQKEDAKEQREILSQVIPLTSKLTEGLEILERVTHQQLKE